jgi:death-on-curing protein
VDWVNNHPRKSIFWKVAVLMREIISGHPFVDGNKRTGFEVVDTILKARGYKFAANQDEILEFILELAMRGKDVEEIVKWLKSNTRKVGVKNARRKKKKETES